MPPSGVAKERIARLIEADVVRQGHRQLISGRRNRPALGAVDDRDRAAPIALTGYAPVAQTIDGGALALLLLLDPRDGGGLGGFDLQAIEEVRVKDAPRPGVGVVAHRERDGVGTL